MLQRGRFDNGREQPPRGLAAMCAHLQSTKLYTKHLFFSILCTLQTKAFFWAFLQWLQAPCITLVDAAAGRRRLRRLRSLVRDAFSTKISFDNKN